MAFARYHDTLSDSKALAHSAREKWGEWIGEAQEWGMYATLTFKPGEKGQEPWPKRSQAKFYQWLRAVSEATWHGGRIGFFVGQEFGARNGRLHYHALLSGVSSVFPELARALWEPNGFAKVVAYDRERGAAAYLTKYVVKDADSQYANWSFPRRWRYPDVAVPQKGPRDNPRNATLDAER